MQNIKEYTPLRRDRLHSTVHKDMARSVFGAPVSWYDATPLGRIFNRFSSDIITLDKDLMNDVSSYSDMVCTTAIVVLGPAQSCLHENSPPPSRVSQASACEQ